MNEGINLLDPKKNSSTDFVGHIQKMRLFVGSLLFIVSVSSVILFIMVELSPLPALQQQEKSLQNTLMQSRDTLVKLTLVDERTTSINTLLSKRLTLDQTLGLIQNKLTSGATITAIQADNKTMTITVTSSSLQSLDTFINGLVNYVQEKKGFSKISLLNLTNDQTTNAYEATLRLYPL